jgi:hypothetical protein
MYVSDAQSFIGEVDLWCTNQQFWEIGAGDEEEHATMLYNYLYYIMSKKKTSTNATVAKHGEHLFLFCFICLFESCRTLVHPSGLLSHRGVHSERVSVFSSGQGGAGREHGVCVA